MKTPVPDYLQHVLTVCQDNDQGALADYIPELAAVDPNKFALALTTVDGTIYSTGDDETEFTMQSMSKPFAYALAFQQYWKRSALNLQERLLIRFHWIKKPIFLKIQ